MENQDRPLTMESIQKTLKLKPCVKQVANYTPGKKYDIDRLHEVADYLIYLNKRR